MKKKVLFFSGNRAEYYLLIPVILSFLKNNNFEVILIKGLTSFDIKNEFKDFDFEKKIRKIYKFKYLSSQTSLIKNNKYFSDLISSSGKLINRLDPKMIFLYGDRFETFAVANACFQLNIPIAHLEGGDITNGGINDDNVRHAITKLSHLHFVTNSRSKKKIINLGEQIWRVKKIGYTGNYYKNFRANKKEIIKKFNLDNTKIILFTLHPDTFLKKEQEERIKICIKSLQFFVNKNFKIIITSPNNDIGSKIIFSHLYKFYLDNKIKITFSKNLGSYYYNGLLALNNYKNYSVVCVGNSSSGIKETPLYKCPTVNIGKRQYGRLKAKNVINAEYKSNKIIKFIIRASSSNFKNFCKKITNPYVSGNLTKLMVSFVDKINLESTSFKIKNEK
jgi:UDP-hydrolysing UDP-N-acetyl-D-glucosamine 2-epimerase